MNSRTSQLIGSVAKGLLCEKPRAQLRILGEQGCGWCREALDDRPVEPRAPSPQFLLFFPSPKIREIEVGSLSGSPLKAVTFGGALMPNSFFSSQTHAKFMPKPFQIHAKTVPTSSSNHAKIIPKSYQNHPKMIVQSIDQLKIIDH